MSISIDLSFLECDIYGDIFLLQGTPYFCLITPNKTHLLMLNITWFWSILIEICFTWISLRDFEISINCLVRILWNKIAVYDGILYSCHWVGSLMMVDSILVGILCFRKMKVIIKPIEKDEWIIHRVCLYLELCSLIRYWYDVVYLK